MNETEHRLERLESKLDMVIGILCKKRDMQYVSKPIFMAITGWSSTTVNRYVTQGYIRKQGNRYSLKSYDEFCETYGSKETRKRKKINGPH